MLNLQYIIIHLRCVTNDTKGSIYQLGQLKDTQVSFTENCDELCSV